MRAGFLRLRRFGQRQLQRRLLLERRRDHKENQQNDQNVYQRADDDGRPWPSFANVKTHGVFLNTEYWILNPEYYPLVFPSCRYWRRMNSSQTVSISTAILSTFLL